MDDIELDRLRQQFIADLRAMEEAAKPTPRQRRVWEFLQLCYHKPQQKAERDRTPAMSPADADWLDDALKALDGLDG